ncbi:J-domain-containing protein [Pseudonocardia sp. Cha107L01]|uniref:DnaJ family domain-containing protein n=1 Tax=Pseudonocardia sp. Cha107L01 TaxID=3457576 RepID=UPI00403E3A91
MSERWSRYESVIDEQIRKAQERGDFDNLPGKGKPLPGLDGPDDDLWWVRGYIRREGLSGDALLPLTAAAQGDRAAGRLGP